MAPAKRSALLAAEPARSSKSAKKEPKKAIKSPLNTAPTQRLEIYVFGSGEYGELGLGHLRRNGKMPRDVKRPRLNDLLDANDVGVVQLDVGGMHCVALTHDNKIITWGVNDNGALGRDTTWAAPEKDIDEDEDDEDSDDTGMNPKESTPEAIPADTFDPGVVFVQVAATDSASFALTEGGKVYGWGTFRVSILLLNGVIFADIYRETMELSASLNHPSLAEKRCKGLPPLSQNLATSSISQPAVITSKL